MKKPLVFVLWCYCLAAAAQDPSLRVVPMYGAFGLARLETQSPSIQEVVSRVESEFPLVVFVPGILGSKLKWDGYTFGESKIDGKRLAFRSKQRPIAETLNEFRIESLEPFLPARFTRKDIYGEALDSLGVLSGGTGVAEFAYDWRADIDESAQAFNQWLSEKNRSGRPTVIVAHSMGGLVVSRWLQTTPKHDRPVAVERVVLVGTPLLGSCEAARMLLQGYGAADGSGVIEDQLVKRLFDSAKPALFTFPSLFQLLPKFSEDTACLKMPATVGGQAVALRHHSPDFWIGAPNRRGGLKGGSGARLTKFAAASGMSIEEYEASVRAAVEAGARFRSTFDSKPRDEGYSIIYAYSTSKDMAAGYNLKWSQDGWFEIVGAASKVKGDGRVVPRSARNEGTGAERWMSRLQIGLSHGDLLKDPSLLQHLQDNVVRTAEAAITQGLAKLLANAQFSRSLKSKGIVIDPGTYTAQFTVDESAGRLAVAQFNASQIYPTDGRLPASALAAYATSTDATSMYGNQTQMSALRAALLESSLIIEPDSLDADTVRTMIELRRDAGQTLKVNTTLERLLRDAKMGGNKRGLGAKELLPIAKDLERAGSLKPIDKYGEFFRYQTEHVQQR